ncbi:hypothetical protein NC981_19275 [Leptolyngbya sp. DQ-M1]|uniref:hypothetical protein n=1 Tax=Leptolyngbya sp. DQ-M1 TaxID=2933920 RepID=UPI00329872A6
MGISGWTSAVWAAKRSPRLLRREQKVGYIAAVALSDDRLLKLVHRHSLILG